VPELSTVIEFVGAMLLRSAHELGQRRQVSRQFSAYVPREVARGLLDEGRFAAAVREQRLAVAVLSCHQRGFNPLAATLHHKRCGGSSTSTTT
jgi:hypothetical protein